MHVNCRKTAATLIRETRRMSFWFDQSLVARLPSFQMKYLGLQLASRPLTKGEWQPVLDKAINLIPPCRDMIRRDGRLILIKNVILARPVHQLVVANAPSGMLEEIVKRIRAFFLQASKKSMEGGASCIGKQSVNQLAMEDWERNEEIEDSFVWNGGFCFFDREWRKIGTVLCQ
jgi:hypothetical protein